MKKDYHKSYYVKNKEKICQRALANYAEHKEERKAKMHEYYLKKKYTPKETVLTTEKELREHIDKVAKKFKFEFTDNKEKIISAKLRMCKEDLKLCPCDHTPDSQRWCGSELCVKECTENKTCHCHFFCMKGLKND